MELGAERITEFNSPHRMELHRDWTRPERFWGDGADDAVMANEERDRRKKQQGTRQRTHSMVDSGGRTGADKSGTII